jgi:hypothetical protein
MTRFYYVGHARAQYAYAPHRKIASGVSVRHAPIDSIIFFWRVSPGGSAVNPSGVNHLSPEGWGLLERLSQQLRRLG